MITGCLLAVAAEAQQQAFPGAEGYGKYTSGGRGGRVLQVTNLDDSGPGSLRSAIEAKGPRTVVFTVSGTVALKSPLNIREGDLTLAGQSAPGAGICVSNYQTDVQADNVIIRYMRFRLGDLSKHEADALGGRRHNKVLIDHCSVSWAIDECASFYYNSNFTMQWCLIYEALNESFHTKGAHGYGGIWGGQKASFHHNLLASNNSRNPRFSGSSTTQNTADELVDFRNNVIYNWGFNSAYGGENGKYNMVNNYYKPGPATKSGVRSRIINPSEPYGQFYVNGNFMAGDSRVTANNSQGVQCKDPQAAIVATAFDVEAVNTTDAVTAYEAVLKGAGASMYRDAQDTRIIAEVRSGKSSSGKNNNGIIDSQTDVGGWPELKSLPAPKDADSDGIPDEWEKAHGLNPNVADNNGHQLDKDYTNLEVYLNSLVK
ncbi:pectate lyase [Chitinophaga sp. Cy-1792]|nr:pectate lyase [Chitinophaga sp. Cy-1792]